MAPLAGNYKFDSQENYVEYLQALGLSEVEAKLSLNKDSQLTIGPITADNVTVSFNGNDMVFVLNKEVEYTVQGGVKKKSTSTLDGEIFTIKTILTDDGSLVEDKVFTPTDDGLIVSSSTSRGAKAARIYKRV